MTEFTQAQEKRFMKFPSKAIPHKIITSLQRKRTTQMNLAVILMREPTHTQIFSLEKGLSPVQTSMWGLLMVHRLKAKTTITTHPKPLGAETLVK
jgi:hypothetical protein